MKHLTKTLSLPSACRAESGAALIEFSVIVLPLLSYLALVFIVCLGFISTTLVAQDALFVYYASNSESPSLPTPRLDQLIVGHTNDNKPWVVQQIQNSRLFDSTNPAHVHIANFVAGVARSRGDAFGHPETQEGLSRIKYGTTSLSIQDTGTTNRRIQIKRYFFPELTDISVKASISGPP